MVSPMPKLRWAMACRPVSQHQSWYALNSAVAAHWESGATEHLFLTNPATGSGASGNMVVGAKTG